MCQITWPTHTQRLSGAPVKFIRTKRSRCGISVCIAAWLRQRSERALPRDRIQRVKLVAYTVVGEECLDRRLIGVANQNDVTPEFAGAVVNAADEASAAQQRLDNSYVLPT